MSEIKIGTIDGLIYRNKDNGYSVLHICGNDGVMFVAVGIMPLIEEGEKAEFNGFWTEHKNYGKQFKVVSYNLIAPTTCDEIEEYLSNGIIRGIGKSTARLIIEKFGEDTFSILDNNPERLMEIVGIGKVKYQMIISSYNQQKSDRVHMIELQKLDITPSQAIKIQKVYGDDCVSIIKRNPYRLIDDIENIGFKTADRIARKTGIAFNSVYRIKAGLKYILDWAQQEGHTYLPYDVLISATVKTICVEQNEVKTALDELIAAKLLACNEINGMQVVFLPYFKRAEMNIAVKLTKLAFARRNISPFDTNSEINKTAVKNNIELAEKQCEALKAVFTQGVTVITGGPGTGKTTILKIAIELMKEWGMSYELAAPTGRAAKRMAIATADNAQTIHRLLEYSFTDKCFLRDECDPIDSDFVIIDEMSMVDVSLMSALLDAITENTRLVLVGDADQLPSVGAGNVLSDILNSGIIYSVKLDEVYRQAEKSLIVTNAHKINNGIKPILNDDNSDFNFFELDDTEKVLNTVVALYKSNDHGMLHTTNTFRDVQLLAPMKKGNFGVYNLNKHLQEAINPQHISKHQIQYGETIFREGDKVMQIKNDYSVEWTKTTDQDTIEEGKGIFNGDIGIINEVDSNNCILTIKFDDGAVAEYTRDMLENIELAYCISIHKSQGSEFNIVLMALVGGPPSFLTRNLLYTAVTRAKSQVYIIGRKDCIFSMVANKSIKQRYTALKYMIKEYYEIFHK